MKNLILLPLLLLLVGCDCDSPLSVLTGDSCVTENTQDNNNNYQCTNTNTGEVIPFSGAWNGTTFCNANMQPNSAYTKICTSGQQFSCAQITN